MLGAVEMHRKDQLDWGGIIFNLHFVRIKKIMEIPRDTKASRQVQNNTSQGIFPTVKQDSEGLRNEEKKVLFFVPPPNSPLTPPAAYKY